MNWTCIAGQRQSRLVDNPLTGLYVPLVTPLRTDGELDAGTLEALAHRVIDGGAAGLVALGTTGEPATLSAGERRTVLDICSRVGRERSVPLIAGAGSNDTHASAQALRELAAWPEVSAALTVVPYFTRPAEEGVIAHFTQLAAGSPVPLIIYNIPGRTGQAVTWPARGGWPTGLGSSESSRRWAASTRRPSG